MAGKKKEDEKTEEKAGEKVEVAPAIKEEQIVKVRGTAVGGVKTMTASEHKKYCEDEAKKAKQAK